MNLILVEDSRSTVESIKNKILSGVPKRSILTVGEESLDRTLQAVKINPMLSKCWYVFVNPRKMNAKKLKPLFVSDRVILIIEFSNTKRAEEFAEDLVEEGLEYKLLDNTKPSLEVLYSYVISKLNISNADAMKLVNRYKGYAPNVIEAVSVLSMLPFVTYDDILRYTRKVSNTNLYSLYFYIVREDKRGSKRKYINLLQNYKHGFEYVIKYLRDFNKKVLNVYYLVSEGKLSMLNVVDYYSANRKQFGDFSIYTVKRIIEMKRTISTDYLLFIQWKLDNLELDKLSIFDIIGLMHLGG